MDPLGAQDPSPLNLRLDQENKFTVGLCLISASFSFYHLFPVCAWSSISQLKNLLLR